MKDPLRVRQKQGASSYGWDSSATPQNDREGEENDREGEENDREGEECREKNGGRNDIVVRSLRGRLSHLQGNDLCVFCKSLAFCIRLCYHTRR